MKSKVDIGVGLIELLVLKREISDELAQRIVQLPVKDRRNVIVGSSVMVEERLVSEVHDILHRTFQLTEEERRSAKLVELIGIILSNKNIVNSSMTFSFFVTMLLNFFRAFLAASLIRLDYLGDVKADVIRNLRASLVSYLEGQTQNYSMNYNDLWNYKLSMSSITASTYLSSLVFPVEFKGDIGFYLMQTLDAILRRASRNECNYEVAL